MDTPTRHDAHRLHILAGQWGGEETVHPAPWDPAGGPATAFVNNRVVLNGLGVVQEYEQYRDGKPTFSGHGLFWWDGAAKEYVMTWFDSMMGTPANYRGHFEGDVLRLTNAMPQGGWARCTFDCGMPGEYVFLMEVSPDGVTWVPALEGAYGRLTQSAPRKRTRTGAAGAKSRRTPATSRKVSGERASSRKASAKASGKKASRKTSAKPSVAKKTAPARKTTAKRPRRRR